MRIGVGVVAGVALLGIALGCRGDDPPPVPQRRASEPPPRAPDTPVVVELRAPEGPVEPETARARATVDRFIYFLEHPWSTQVAHTVLVRVESGTGPRFIWLDLTHYDGRYLTGTLSEAALPDHPHGQAVRVLPSEIIDWIIGGPHVLCGAFTERRKWAASSSREKARMLEFWEIDRLPAGDELCEEKDVEEEGH